VQNNPYLGLQISDDLKWTTHITNVTKKANSTLGFLRRNLKYCPKDCKKTAYISLVRSTMEYGAIVWDPYITLDTNKLEKIQRRAARFITGDYKSSEEGSVTKMLAELELESLQSRRTSQRLILLYKVVEGLVPAIKPEDYLTKSRQRRTIVFFFFIFTPLCRRTIRQYVEQVLRLCTVLVFHPPFDFVHIYTVKYQT
jgi:hypothetical protein